MPLVYNNLVFARCRKPHKYFLSRAKFSCSRILTARFQIYKEKENFALVCLRPPSNLKLEISRGSPRKRNGKEMYKKCDAGAKLLICLLNLLVFLCSRCILNSVICLFFGGDGPGGGRVVLFNHFARPP